jgi:hypothetical protein
MAGLFGTSRLGAWLRARKSPAKPAAPRPAESVRPQPPRKRLWALVQVKPAALVLAVSDSRENLEAEAHELNDTWNHRELRTERHVYEIQPVALLQTGRDFGLRSAGKTGQKQVG